VDEGLRVASYALWIGLALLAIPVARRERDHRPFAVYAVWMPASDWVRIGLRALRAGVADPQAGLGRVLFHLGEAIVLSWSFALLAIVLLAFTRIRPWPATAGWLVSMAVCLDYSAIRFEVLETLYRTVGISCMGAGLLAVAWALAVRRDLAPRLHHLAIMVLLAGELVTYLFPLVSDLFRDWDVVRGVNLVVLAVLCALHVQRLRQRAPQPSRGVST
jgi:hypothetical protein